jgi:metal-sulfur cluster biosynthetic enzyme
MNGQNGSDVATTDDVMEALEGVIDPELGLDFVTLGLIYEVRIDDDGGVDVVYSLTSPGCPIGPQVAAQVVELVGELDGVTEVRPQLVFSPPWTPERLSEDARFALGF